MTTIAVISLLHESADSGSIARRFRGEPVLAWTLRRSGDVAVDTTIVLAWDDQVSRAQALGVHVHACGQRRQTPASEAVIAAQKWADGWRGGLLSTACFDRGFSAVHLLAAMGDAEAAVLIDPAAALVEADILSNLVRRARFGDRELYFTNAAPGVAGVVIRRSLVERLAKSGAAPGRIVHYMPDAPIPDPITSDACIEVPLALSRTRERLLLDSDRALRHVDAATVSLNGTLATSNCQTIIERLQATTQPTPPREVTIEITTRRATRPVFAATTHLSIERADMSVEMFTSIVSELASVDDIRVTLAGVGDPLLHPQIELILDVLSRVHATCIETDLVDVSDAVLNKIIHAGIDVVTLHTPALTPPTYEQAMGVDAYTKVIENLRRLLVLRGEARRGVPIVTPLFTKMADNLEEMECWHDTWLRAVGSAVIVGPTTFAGQIPDTAAADMSPPLRVACRRIESRLTILSDGRVVACEQDVLGAMPMGDVNQASILSIWARAFPPLRERHGVGIKLPQLCTACREWDRP